MNWKKYICLFIQSEHIFKFFIVCFSETFDFFIVLFQAICCFQDCPSLKRWCMGWGTRQNVFSKSSWSVRFDEDERDSRILFRLYGQECCCYSPCIFQRFSTSGMSSCNIHVFYHGLPSIDEGLGVQWMKCLM